MKKRSLDKITLDRIGEQLIRNSTVSSKDIDSLVSDPELFAGVRVKIQEELSPVSGYRSIRRYAAVFASLAVIVSATVTALLMTRTPPASTARTITAPAEMPVEARPVNPPPLRAGSNPTSGRAFTFEPATERPSPTKASTAAVPRSRKNNLPRESEGEFYAISNDGDISSTGGHIIRVDMPRSSLFALGVNVPLENNDSDTVKADLLVGPDGATRAIRVVK